MIPINFPADPSNYNFVIANDFGSAYLLARAVRHYGANNINVVNITPFNFKSSNSIHKIADVLGINMIRTITLQGVAPDQTHLYYSPSSRTPSTSKPNITAVTEVMLDFLKCFNPSYESIQQVDDGLFSDSYSGVSRAVVLALLIDAGIINADLTVNTTNAYKTLVMDWSQDGGIDTVYTEFMKNSYANWNKVFTASQPEGPFWIPLRDYNIDQILEDAKEIGMIEPLLAIHHCKHNRPLQCGICSSCKERRNLLIQADIEDTTEYSFT